MSPAPRLLARLYDNAYVLLTGATLMWAGNSIIGIAAVGEVTPMTLTFLRWFFVCLILVALYRRDVEAAAPVLAPRWRWVTAMAVLGYTAFNALLYGAAHHTSGINLTMLQSSIPVMVLVGGAVAFGSRVTGVQALGTALTVIGVLVVASGGDIRRLLGLEFNAGDLYVLSPARSMPATRSGCAGAPAISGFGLFIGFAVVAMVSSLPLLLYEMARASFFWPGLRAGRCSSTSRSARRSCRRSSISGASS